MEASDESIFKTRLTKLLSTSKLVKSIYFFENLDSTQDYAHLLPNNDSLHGTLIIARSQKMGRVDRKTLDITRGGYVSIVLVLNFSRIISFHSVYFALRCRAIRETTKITFRLSGPMMYEYGKKVCGILVDLLEVNKRISWDRMNSMLNRL